MDTLAWFMLAGVVVWLLLLASNVSRPAANTAPKPGALEVPLPPDAVLVLSSSERLTAEEMLDLSANLSAALLNPRRPLVLIVPPGFRVEAVLRCPTNSAGKPGTTEG